ncbi:hypothetical protein [Enterovirga aerilata]|uniref:WYL domain-containing protein n=1 Tax=Enterovirga aerilata TaxID=2730920 RepID=A0A849I7X4_9HYPH|nr:hypothetical protein [Enterovirga sp. DB1703]NNM72509.1 hypothetical protein [Enterovirga sp. DB1703]
MPSATYEVFRQAILQQKQVVCDYDGHPRELCPVILGHTSGEERVFAYQVGGSGSKGLPPGGAWRCLTLARVGRAALRDGPWREGSSHMREQTCVTEVELDINIHVRGRRL